MWLASPAIFPKRIIGNRRDEIKRVYRVAGIAQDAACCLIGGRVDILSGQRIRGLYRRLWGGAGPSFENPIQTARTGIRGKVSVGWLKWIRYYRLGNTPPTPSEGDGREWRVSFSTPPPLRYYFEGVGTPPLEPLPRELIVCFPGNFFSSVGPSGKGFRFKGAETQPRGTVNTSLINSGGASLIIDSVPCENRLFV